MCVFWCAREHDLFAAATDLEWQAIKDTVFDRSLRSSPLLFTPLGAELVERKDPLGRDVGPWVDVDLRLCR